MGFPKSSTAGIFSGVKSAVSAAIGRWTHPSGAGSTVVNKPLLPLASKKEPIATTIKFPGTKFPSLGFFGGTHILQYRFEYPHVPSHGTANILENPDHPLHLLVKHKHKQELPRDELNLWVHAPKWHPKKVVRDHQVRRVRNATVLALKAEGLGRNGKSLVDGRPVLVGSLQVRVHPGSLDTPFGSVKAQCSLMVDRVLRKVRQASSNRLK